MTPWQLTICLLVAQFAPVLCGSLPGCHEALPIVADTSKFIVGGIVGVMTAGHAASKKDPPP